MDNQFTAPSYAPTKLFVSFPEQRGPGQRPLLSFVDRERIMYKSPFEPYWHDSIVKRLEARIAELERAGAPPPEVHRDQAGTA